MDTRARKFMSTETGLSLRAQLEEIEESLKYNTASTYYGVDVNGQTFTDRQLIYMSQYPNLNYEQYISNLKLKIKI